MKDCIFYCFCVLQPKKVVFKLYNLRWLLSKTEKWKLASIVQIHKSVSAAIIRDTSINVIILCLILWFF